MVEIRDFKGEDVDEVLSILRACFSPAELEEVDRANLLGWHHQFPGGMRVAVIDGQIVGFVFAFSSRRVGWITLLCVKPEFRGRGIGGSLLRSAIDHLSGQGIRVIKLDVEVDNPAVEFYKKFGFEVERRLLRLRKIL
ncbi:MAG: GNAT family N-acetyltransferase [Hadesarchaea archaeon]|nr:GNAT family N-acetyltransferase [Hadesarchaea archaeon]